MEERRTNQYEYLVFMHSKSLFILKLLVSITNLHLSPFILFDCRCMLIIDLCQCQSRLTSSVPLILFLGRRLMMTMDSLFQACAGGRTQTCLLLPTPLGALKCFRWFEVVKRFSKLTEIHSAMAFLCGCKSSPIRSANTNECSY